MSRENVAQQANLSAVYESMRSHGKNSAHPDSSQGMSSNHDVGVGGGMSHGKPALDGFGDFFQVGGLFDEYSNWLKHREARDSFMVAAGLFPKGMDNLKNYFGKRKFINVNLREIRGLNLPKINVAMPSKSGGNQQH